MERVWFDRTFAELTTAQLYRIIELRERVFIVEQRCVYLDADGVDLVARHCGPSRRIGSTHICGSFRPA